MKILVPGRGEEEVHSRKGERVTKAQVSSARALSHGGSLGTGDCGSVGQRGLHTKLLEWRLINTMFSNIAWNRM